jgi:signal transduction histidine kinase
MVSVPALAQPPRPAGEDGDRSPSKSNAERWLRQLANDLDHLEEDLYYERGNYPEGLRDRIDQVARSVAHFQHVFRQSDNNSHVRKDFQEMDKQVHELVKVLNQSNDSWLRRQASRLTYADEQLHYNLPDRVENQPGNRRELLARQAHLLETEARDLAAIIERVVRRDQRLREEINTFVEHVDHFHRVVEGGAQGDHVRDDFRKVDKAWHQVVERVNGSSYAYYLRNAAQNVNRVHNQIEDLLNTGHEEAQKETPPPAKPVPSPPPRRRPAIEFEIPGIGRFQIPQ